jgi:hypothetical protein
MRAPRLEADGSSEARFLSHMAWLEAGAVHGFRQLAVELAGHHAPARFVRAARRAARDEVRHARTARALARRYGGVVPPVDVPPPVERPLVELAIENAVEGCVSETFGAIVAALQAATAEDAVVRAALARIVIDETRHAELAFELRDWLDGRLDRGARARVQDAYHRAVATLRSGVLHGANEQASRRLGVPGQARMQSILDEAATTLWA